MKANIECYFCCVRKIEGLLKQYNVSDSDSIEILKNVSNIIYSADNDISAGL